ncbi:MAG: hypothetical protein WCK49_07050 [Myxococcaceae bacterium]
MKLFLLVSIFVFGESIFAANWKKSETDNGFEYENMDNDTSIHKISVLFGKNSQIQRVAMYHQDNAREIAIDDYDVKDEPRESFRWDLRKMLLAGQIQPTMVAEIMNQSPLVAAQSAPLLEAQLGISPLGGSGSMTR